MRAGREGVQDVRSSQTGTGATAHQRSLVLRAALREPAAPLPTCRSKAQVSPRSAAAGGSTEMAGHHQCASGEAH